MTRRNQTNDYFWGIVNSAADAAATPGGGRDLHVGFNAFTPEHAKRISDRYLILILEQIESAYAKQPGSRDVRAIILAEQSRREDQKHNALLYLSIATLAVALASLIVQLIG